MRAGGSLRDRPGRSRLAQRLLFDQNPQPVWILDVETLAFLDANAAAEALYGYSRRELLRRTIADDLPDDVRAQLLAKRDALSGSPSRGVWSIRRRDGSERWIEVITQAMPGARARRLVIGRDITEERATAMALRESERRFARLSEAGIIGVVIADGSGRIRETNQAFLDIVGYTRADFDAGLVRWDTLTPPEWEGVSERVIADLHSESIARLIEKEYLRKDGRRVPVLLAAAALTPPEHITLVLDLTARRATQEALRRSESLFRAIVEASPDALSVCTEDTTIIYSSPAGADLTGLPLSMLVGTRLVDSPMIADRDAYLREWRRCLAQPGVPLRYRFLSRRADGGAPRYLESIRTSHLDDPNLRGVVTILRDLTEQHRLEGELRHAQKMEAIGSLAGGVAHDFNNLLTVILSYAEGLLDAAAPDSPERADLEEIFKAGERAAALTRQLLAFSRRQVLDPRVLDLRVTVGDVEKLTRRLLGEHIEIVARLADPLDLVRADPTQIAQVLMNLTVNARDAMPTGGTLTITLENARVSEADADALPGATPGEFVVLSVTDTGTGMTPEVRERIFEPFFTTKKEGGTGLGLATVFGIVRQSGGFIAVDSELGAGSTFRVYLPVTREAVVAAAPARTSAVPRSRRATVLVAEDEEQVRNLVCEVLRRQGYDVLPVSNAADALLASERHAGPIHLLLTDLVMPKMMGRELADRLASARPQMAILYMSGYTEDAEVQRQVSVGRAGFLAKPVTPEVLLRRVGELIDAASPPAGSEAGARREDPEE